MSLKFLFRFSASALAYTLGARHLGLYSHCSSVPPPPKVLPSIPDCQVPACASKAELFAKSMGSFGAAKEKKKQSSSEDDKGKENSSDESKKQTDIPPKDEKQGSSNSKNTNSLVNSKDATNEGSDASPRQCPLDREELGRSSWDLIHTVAAFYPENPSEAEQAAARNLILSLAILYPCPICAADLRSSVVSNQPKVSSRTEFALWCCNLHNDVNVKINKGTFKCDMESLDKRWRDGPQCWNQLYEERKDL